MVYESWKNDKLNFLPFPAGSGKTTAITSYVPQNLNLKKILIIESRKSKVDQMIAEGEAVDWESRNFSDTIVVLTYQKFGYLVKTGEINSYSFDLIAADEIHDLAQSINMDKGNIVQQYGGYLSYEEMMTIFSMTPSHIAAKALLYYIKETNIWVCGMTATPQRFYNSKNEALQQLKDLVNEVQLHDALRSYKVLSTLEYDDYFSTVLNFQENKKRLIFTPTIKKQKETQKLLEMSGRKSCAIWSIHSQIPMNEKQLKQREYFHVTGKFPPEIQDMIINRAEECGININEKIDEIIIDSNDETSITQVCGRPRADIPILYKPKLKKERQLTIKNARNNSFMNFSYEIPERFINKKLSTNDKKELIKEINFPKAWNSLKKWLLEHNFEVKHSRSGNKEFDEIRRNCGHFFLPDL